MKFKIARNIFIAVIITVALVALTYGFLQANAGTVCSLWCTGAPSDAAAECLRERWQFCGR